MPETRVSLPRGAKKILVKLILHPAGVSRRKDRPITQTSIPIAKHTGRPDRRFAVDGRHDGIPIAKAGVTTAGAVLDPSRPTPTIGQASAEPHHGQLTSQTGCT